MFLNITEDDIRADCPHSAPMTLRAFNKISPRQFNTSVSAINPFEIPRYAPSSVAQFSKSLLQQQVMPQGQMTTALELAEVESAVLAATVVEDFIDNIGFDPPTEAQRLELYIENVGAEEEKEGELLTQLPNVPSELPPVGDKPILLRSTSLEPPPPPITATDFPGKGTETALGAAELSQALIAEGRQPPKPALRGRLEEYGRGAEL